MKVLFATSEAVPYWKTGGLADVARGLPDALHERGVDVRIVHPLYAPVRAAGLDLRLLHAPTIDWPDGPVAVRFLEHRPAGAAPAVLVDQPAFFDTDTPYAAAADDPDAPGRRFAFFARAVVEFARIWRADVVHLNDWPTGLVPVYANLLGLPAASVLAIHNMAYQGNFAPAILPRIGIPDRFMKGLDGIEFFGHASFLKAGLVFAHRLVTVSPTYAAEILTEEFGAGLDGVLRARRHTLHGILNGIDTRRWNPAADPAISARYDAASIARKDINRDQLLHELGLDPRGPVFAMVARLAHQKGVDLVLDAVHDLVKLGGRLAVLGDGDPDVENGLATATAEHPRRVAAVLRFDDRLARRIYAGADFFLMPSRFEPCGLGQMIAQRYGTPPVVRHTGGLVDTVQDRATGFAFGPPSTGAMLDAVARAAAVWRTTVWDRLRRRCMRIDNSWDRSAALYLQLYRAAIHDAFA